MDKNRNENVDASSKRTTEFRTIPNMRTNLYDPSWTIREEPFVAASALANEGLFTLGSGYLHVRGSMEEPVGNDRQNRSFMRLPGNVTAEKFLSATQKWGTYIPGVYGDHPLLNRQMINLPFGCEIVLTVDGERLDLASSSIVDHTRLFNLKTASLVRSLIWHTKAGPTLYIRFDRFISAVHPQLIVQRVTIIADSDCTVYLRAGIHTDIRTGGYDHIVNRALDVRNERVRNTIRIDTDIEVMMNSVLHAEDETNLAFQTPVLEERYAGINALISLRAGKEATCYKYTAYSTSIDVPSRVSAEDVINQVQAEPYEKLFDEHQKNWNSRWEKTDVVIEGNPNDQLAMRVSLYHLLRSHPGDERVAIEPKGYAGDAYFGRFFWDTEMYLVPFFLYTDPALAQMLIDFRVRTLNGARHNAQRYGYKGARYAWESDDFGEENCAAWQYADHEVHVTADVVYAFAHYNAAVPSSTYLMKPEVAEVIVETCRYWVERVDKRPDDDYPSLLGVMGPDEYAPMCNNNAYTNRMVRFALQLASGEIGKVGGATDKEREVFEVVGKALPIPRSKRNPQLLLQCDGFESFAEADFKALWPDRKRPYAAQVAQERLYRGKNLKQADVLMMMYLFPNEFTDEEVRCAWEYYVPWTTHDSSLSAGVHAIIACRLGMLDKAYEFWGESSGIDIDGGAEQGIHIASCGANWQIAIFGFAGIENVLASDELILRPRLPHSWKRMTFPFLWRDIPLHVEITQQSVRLDNKGSVPIMVRVFESQYVVAERSSVTVPF